MVHSSYGFMVADELSLCLNNSGPGPGLVTNACFFLIVFPVFDYLKIEKLRIPKISSLNLSVSAVATLSRVRRNVALHGIYGRGGPSQL